MQPGPGKSEPFGILNWKSFGHPNGLAGSESPDRVTHYNFTEYDFARPQVRVRAGSRLKLALVGCLKKDVGPDQFNRPYTGIPLP